jgi:uncharacterized protein
MSAIPMVTALYAAIIGLLAAALTANVIRYRVKFKVNNGDGNAAPLGMAIRAQANLVQLAPLALLLIGYAEATGTSRVIIHILGAALVGARLLSAWGLLTVEGPSFVRQAGAGLTILVMVAVSIIVLVRLGNLT